MIGPASIAMLAAHKNVGPNTVYTHPVELSFTPVALVSATGPRSASISPVIFALTPVALTTSGVITRSISPVIFALTPHAFTIAFGSLVISDRKSR